MRAKTVSSRRFSRRRSPLSSGLMALALVASFASARAVATAPQEADKVYVNGIIYTVDDAFSTATALAIKDGRFVYVGDDAGAKARIGPRTSVFDLGGKTVIPGLHDSHVHIRYGERELYPQVPDIRATIGEWASVERLKAVIKRCLATGEGMRPGPEPRWLVLSGWMSDVWDPPAFRKELIDAVAPDNPVYISRYTHGSGANSKALELAGIDRNTPDPPGGHIKKDANGEPTGEFVERAPARRILIPWASLIAAAAPFHIAATVRNPSRASAGSSGRRTAVSCRLFLGRGISEPHYRPGTPNRSPAVSR